MLIESLSRTARLIGGLCAAIVHPIAWPGWTIERLVQSRRANWEFSPYSATPYFVVLGVGSTLCALSGPFFIQIVGLYVLFAMELLAIWICLAIFSGNPESAPWVLLLHHGNRTFTRPPDDLFASSHAIYSAGVAFLYTAYFFAVTTHVVYSHDNASYENVRPGSIIEVFWQFLYFSVVTITSFGHGKIMPKSFLAEALSGLELLLGLFLVLFLFGGFASYHVGRLKR